MTATTRRETKAAKEGLAQALQRHEDARNDLAEANRRRDELHTRLGQGEAAITADALALADAVVRRAELLHQAAAAAINPAKARVAAADLAVSVDAAAAYAATRPDNEVRRANIAAANARQRAEEVTALYHRRIREIGHDLRARGVPRVPAGADSTGWVGPGEPGGPEGFNIAGGPCLTTWDDLRR